VGLYYECHINLEPDEKRRDTLDMLCESNGPGFRVAKLRMEKEASTDAFVTGRGGNYEELVHRMTILVNALRREGFTVLRYKIEEALLDSKVEDSLSLL
jgi:hypothetical protein